MVYQTIQARFDDAICFVKLDRPQARNAINDLLIQELHQVLARCEQSASVVVLEGSPEVFCMGADFGELAPALRGEKGEGPEPLYDLWLKMATGPYITISHVRGKANAGGVGFVAASDIALCDEGAEFSLSELLFGLFPACVLPFLIRRVGFQKAHYLTLMTQPIPARTALDWGLVDACQDQSGTLLRRHLLRLRRLSKKAIAQYKGYLNRLPAALHQAREPAVAANRELFCDPQNLRGILRYHECGKFPWEN